MDPQRPLALLSSVLLSASVLWGCATSDYGRITAKIAAYEAKAAEIRAELDGEDELAARIRDVNALVRNTENQLKIARRINPQTNPEYRSKSITIDAARAEKEQRISQLEARLAEYMRWRNDLIAESAGTKPPAS